MAWLYILAGIIALHISCALYVEISMWIEVGHRLRAINEHKAQCEADARRYVVEGLR